MNVSSLKGFTLIELLVVVAIVGILASVGLPNLSKLMQRSRQSEAKANLGVLYTTEVAFFSEWGAYGNNLDAVGYEPQTPLAYFHLGFMNNAGAPPSTIQPSSGDAFEDLTRLNPDYFNNAVYRFDSRSGEVGTGLAAGAFANVPNTVSVTADGSNFSAVAVGNIKNGIQDSTLTAPDADIWTIDDQRNLINQQDGAR